MSPEDVREVFREFGEIAIRRMFGGMGLYRDGCIFAIVIDGEIFMKADATTASALREAGSSPFTYDRQGRAVAMSYWRIPVDALDDPDEAKRWGELALSVSREAKRSRKRSGELSGDEA